MTINQGSNRAIINWQTFSINSGELTKFIQPSSTSAMLNRVLGGQTSLINGTLSANGQIYLINGNGIVVGPSGVITANAFTASTRDVADSDFLNGNLHFMGSGDAGVQNLGNITALGGDVVLIGKTVDNEGTINAANGTAGLVAGDDVLLAQQNADGSTITVSASPTATSASTQTGVKNSGTITATSAELKAANGNIYSFAIQNQGTVRATTVQRQGGHIWLTSDAGTISNSGTLDASAAATAGTGGSITVKTGGLLSQSGTTKATGSKTGGTVSFQAPDISLSQGSDIDVSSAQGTGGSFTASATDEIVGTTNSSIVATGGQDGGFVGLNLTSNADLIYSGNIDVTGGATGGTISLLGGSLVLAQATLRADGALGGGTMNLGGGTSGLELNGVPDSTLVYLSTGTVLSANATTKGNGGTLNLWSAGSIESGATISARGGPEGGSGGKVEISGQTGFALSGPAVDLTAPLGTVGVLTLDPQNLTISDIIPPTTTLVLTLLAQDFPPPNVIPDGNPGNFFGNAVALSGNYELIGAPYANSGGEAYLFNNGALNAVYTDPVNGSGDTFGSALALTGTNVLIGAPYTTIAGNSSQGVAYLYNMTSNVPLVTYNDPLNAANDDFGGAVALTGTNALIGAYGTTVGMNSYEGAAYLFNLTNGVSPVTSYTDAGNAIGDFFGISVALTTSNALIGASGAYGGNGGAYLYDLSGTLLETYTDADGGQFGGSVALSATNALVGARYGNGNAGEAFLFSLTSPTAITSYYEPTAVYADEFGQSVALSGSDALIGSDGTNSFAGAAYLFDLSGTLLTTYTDPIGTSGDNFGQFVALSGNNVLIGAPGVASNTGAAYLYNVSGPALQNTITAQTFAPAGPPVPDGTPGDNFGSAVALDGNYELIGAPNNDVLEGAAYLFNNGALSMKYTDPDGNSDDYFGVAVALSGGNALVGAEGTHGFEGSAYLYSLTSNTPTTTFTEPGATLDDDFGNAVALNGSYVLVGAEGVNYSQGAAYLFGLGGTLLETYIQPSPATSNQFGGSVALNGSNALVGAEGVDNAQGAAYLYNFSSPTPIFTFTDPRLTDSDYFGSSVALNDSQALVGGASQNGLPGAAYLYSLGTNALVLTYNDPNNIAADSFGQAVALSDSNALIGAPNTNGQGAAYLYNLTSSTALATFTDPANTAYDNFGGAVALSGSIGLVGADGTNSSTGAAYLYNIPTYGNMSATDETIALYDLEQLLLTSSVVLQANNDLTLDVDSTLFNPSTNNLTLEAGESILLNSSIYTGGNVTLIANDTAADGVVNTARGPGIAVITMANGTTINAGPGAISISLLNGAGNFYNSTGDITLGALSGGSLTVTDLSTSGAAITFNDQVEANGSGTAISIYSTHGTITSSASGSITALNGDITLNAQSIALGNSLMTPGTVTFNSAGTITDTGDVNVGIFILQNGSWNQNGTLPVFSAENDFEIQNGTFLRVEGGDGASVGTAYQIVDEYGLQGIGSPSGNLLGAYFIQTANIDASSAGGWNGENGFVPIGNSTTPFSGSYNGNGYVISDLTIYQPGQNKVGLFGQTNSSAYLRDIGLVGGSVLGNAYAGALVGFNQGTVASSYATGEMEVGTINNYAGGLVGWNEGAVEMSYSDAMVNGSGDVGGLVGHANGGVVETSYATGPVYGSSYSTGGLVGYNDGTVETSYATGPVTGAITSTGGLVGLNDGLVETSYSTGTVISPGAGGLVGYGGMSGPSGVTSSYWATDTSGVMVSDGGTAETLAQLQQQNTFQPQGTGPSNWDFTLGTGVWGINGMTSMGVVNGGLPYFQWQFPTQALITPSSQSLVYSGTTGTLDPSAYTTTFAPGYSSLAPLLSADPTFFLFGDNVNVVNAGPVNTIQVGLTVNPGYVVEVSTIPATVTYTPKPVTVSAVNLTDGPPATYGTTPAFANDGAAGQLVGSDTLGGTVTYTNTDSYSIGGYLNTGTYAYVPAISGANSNYSLSYSAAGFTVSPATLLYVADPVTRDTTQPNPSFTGMVDGFLTGETIANATTGTLNFMSSATAASTAGSYDITGYGLAANNGNYILAQSSGNATALTITNPGGSTPPPDTGETAMMVAQQVAEPLTPVSQAAAQTSANSSTASSTSATVTPPPTPTDSDSDSSGSSNSPSSTGQVVPGQTVTLGGAGNQGPPPAVIQAAFDQGFSADSRDSLATAAFGDAAAASTGSNTGTGNGNQPASTGMVVPGQTLTLGGAGNHGPPPAVIQAAFDQGFSADSRASLATAAFGDAAASGSGSHTGTGGGNQPASTGMVVPGQTVTLGGAGSHGPPPAVIQAAFDQGFSPGSRAQLSNAAFGK